MKPSSARGVGTRPRPPGVARGARLMFQPMREFPLRTRLRLCFAISGTRSLAVGYLDVGENAYFPRLFSPLRVGRRTLRNRIALPATTTNYGARNRVTDRWISFLAERAKGGAGMSSPKSSRSIRRRSARRDRDWL